MNSTIFLVVLLKLREKQIQNCKNLSEVLNHPTDPTRGQAVVDGILEREGVQCVGSSEVYAPEVYYSNDILAEGGLVTTTVAFGRHEPDISC